METRGRAVPGGTATSPESAMASELFDQFVSAGTFKSVLSTYRQLCEVLRLKPTNITNFYPRLKAKLHSWRAASLWTKLDKRASHKCYNRGKACPNTRVLIIGAGPCGLRAAIEAQLLGAKVVIVEKRDRFSRNNVLHLWPFVIHDLRNLGAKKFFGKFCAGSIDHISIRQLQIILLKVALLLGVEVHENVGFESLIEPSEDQTLVGIGWHARVSPPDHPVSQYEFDVLIGADGKRNTLLGFNRKEFRGKLAIAVTANFINRHTIEEARVPEISGVAFIFNQKFFQDMREQTAIDLENIVYYKDDTHYFVMTAKKQSLLERGVIIRDYNDTARLLAAENVDREALMEYARDAADFATSYQLPSLDFAVNHYGQADVAMFDFTSMYAAENACRVIERKGHKLLQSLVGDSLLEPFWPTGSGCARGFLSSFDAAWMIRSWASGRLSPLQVLAEREAIYRLLAQTTPENLSKDLNQYTLNPSSRYPNLNLQAVLPSQVRSLYDTDGKLEESIIDVTVEAPKKKRRKESMIHPDTLLNWCQKQVALNDKIKINDFTSSWKNGLALSAILHRYRPDLIDLLALDPENVAKNNQLAFDICEKELGIPPVMTGQEMAECTVPDKLTMVSYISQVYESFRGEIPVIGYPKINANEERTASPNKQLHSTPLSIINKISCRFQHKRKYSVEKELSKERERGENVRRRSSSLFAHKRKSKEKGVPSDILKQDVILTDYKSITANKPRESINTRVKNLEAKIARDAGHRFYNTEESESSKASRIRSEQTELNIKLLQEQLQKNGSEANIKKSRTPKVGKLRKDEWNVKIIEEKTKQQQSALLKNSTPEKPKIFKEIFINKRHYMDEKLKAGGALTPEEAAKYKKIDDALNKLQNKLTKGTMDVGDRGNNQTAAMAEHMATIWDKKAGRKKDPLPPAPVVKKAAGMEISANLPSSEVCYFCKERVYLLQRLSAEGLFFHRSCFKCEYCSASLRLGNYSFDRDAICGGKFYCIPHFRMQKPENRHMEIMKRKQEFLTRAFEEEKEKLYKTLLDNTEKALSPGKQLTDKASKSVTDSPKTPDAQKQDNVQKSTNLLTEPSSTFGRDQTPERVEYENSIIELSEEELLTSELEEEELTQKNLGPSQDLATSEDEYSDLSTDTESDEEAFAEELERSLTADETRKLAETWNRKYSAEHSLIDTVSSSADDEGSDTEIGSEDTSDDVDSNAEYSLESSEEECDQAEKEEEKLLSVDAKDEFTVQVPVIDLKSINRISEDETSSESDISEEETDEDEDSEGESESGTEVDSESEPKAPLPPPLIPKIIIHESPPQDIDLDQEWEVETPSLQNDNSVHDTPLCDDSVVILSDSAQNNPLCDDSVVILSDSAQNNELELSVEIVESVPKHPDTNMAVAENYDASSYKDADGKSNQNDTAKNLDYSQFRTEEEITCQVKEKVIAPLATEESSSDLSVSSGINSLAKEIVSDVLNAAKDSISKQKSSMHLYGLKIIEPSSCAFSDSTQHSEKTSFSDSWMILSSSTSEEAKIKLIDLTSSDQPNDKVEVLTIITPVSNNVEIIDLCSPSDLNTEDRFTVVSPRDQTNDSDLFIHSKGDDDHNHSVPNEDYISSSPLDSNLLKEKDVEEKFDFQIETEDTEVIAKSIFLDDSMEDVKEISMFDEYLDNSPENTKFDSANVTLRKKRRFSCEGEGFNWDSDNSISLPHCYGEEESCISVDEIEKKMEHTTDGVYHADVVQAIQIEGTENNNQEVKVTKSGKEIKKLSFEICSDKASEFQNTKDYQLCSSLSQSLPNSSSYLKHDSTFQTSTPYNFYSFEDAKHSAPVPKRTMTPDRPELSAEIRYEKFSEHESVKENLSFSTSEMNVIDSDVSELQNKLKQETPESISPKADTKYKGYSGSFAEKVRPKSLFCDTIYLRSLDINLQKQPFSSLNKSNDKLDECNKTETADGIRRKLFTESPSLSKSEDELDEYRIEYENQIKQNLINRKSELSYPSDKYYAKTEIEQNRLVLETSSVADDKLSSSRLKSSAAATENSNKSVDIGISKSKISSHKHSSVSFSAPESCNDLVSPYTYAQARPLFENKFPTKMRPKCDMDIIKLKQKREKRKSVHEDIQGLPFADEEKLISPVEPLDACDVFLTPKTSNRKISDSNSSSAPAWKTPDLIDEERYLRLQSTVDQEKARQEARARARLKSDEELGLSPNNYRKKYTRQLSLNSINYDELCSDEFCDQDDELEDEIISNFCQTKSSGIEETFNMFKKNSLYLKTKNPELALASSQQPAQSKEKILPSNCDREIRSNTNIPQPVDMAVPICLLDSVMKEVVVSKKLGDYESEGNLSKSKEMLQPSKHSNQSSSSETSPEIFTSEGTFDSKITNKGKSKASRAESSGDDDKSKSNGKKSIFSILNFGKTHVSREKVKQKSKDSEKDFSSAAATDICNRINSKSKPFSHLKLAKSKEKISKPKAKPVPADSSFVSPTENSQEDASNVSFNEQQAKIIPKYTVYRNPETTISSFPVHLPIPKLENGLAPKASEDSFSDEDETQGSKAGHIPNTEKNDKNSTEKDNKTLRMVQKVQRQQVLKRLRSAQEIQRRLEELEIKQKELEQQGVEVEKMFRREGHGSDSKEEAELMQKWYTLIHSKNKLTREEQELVIRLKDLELEDRHSKLQQTLRERLAQNSDKTEVQIMEERKILAEMLEIVEKRDELVAMLEQLRLREVEEEKNVTTEVFSKGMKSPLSPGEKS